eukprot:gene6018-biopygen4307
MHLYLSPPPPPPQPPQYTSEVQWHRPLPQPPPLLRRRRRRRWLPPAQPTAGPARCVCVETSTPKRSAMHAALPGPVSSSGVRLTG